MEVNSNLQTDILSDTQYFVQLMELEEQNGVGFPLALFSKQVSSSDLFFSIFMVLSMPVCFSLYVVSPYLLFIFLCFIFFLSFTTGQFK